MNEMNFIYYNVSFFITGTETGKDILRYFNRKDINFVMNITISLLYRCGL